MPLAKKNLLSLTICILCILTIGSAGFGQTVSEDSTSSSGTKYLFYKGYNYGSQANYNPWNNIANGMFDCLQITNPNNNPGKINFDTGNITVNWNLERAFWVIDRYGWEEFIKTEMIPFSVNKDCAQYWPNYQIHLIGGGMTYVATTEWFKYYGYPYPKTLSVITMGFMHYGNEVVEHNRVKHPTVDPIADLLIFDPLGIIVFSIPGVPEFFANTLYMADWSFQPIYNLCTDELENNGQQWSLKMDIPWIKGLERWRLFGLIGTEGVGGISYRYNSTDNISIGAGLATHDIVRIDERTDMYMATAKLKWTGGIFYDRNHSLLASLILGGPQGYAARLNLYPGVLKFGSFQPGLVGILRDDHSVLFGLNWRWLPAGLGYTTNK